MLGDPEGLPPTYVVLAEVDVLHDEGVAYADRLRSELARYPFQSALKTALVAQGALEDASVRRPLRPLTPGENAALTSWLQAVAIPGEQATETYADSPAA